MTELKAMGWTGQTVAIPTVALDPLRDGLRGSLVLPGDNDYDEARSIWNAMIDRRPALVIRCAGTADVMRGVNFARERALLLAVRSGGHNIAGNAVCDGGVMLDLSLMKSVRVDPSSRTARVEPGATLGDVDNEAQTFGLATPLGINSTTGVAGLTLGGGFGWLSRKHGLTVDNLRSADVVTASGELITASEDEHSDLFWGIRGGSGNFGVVTSFEFGLHEVGPELLCGLIFFPFEDAAEILRQYRQIVATAPDELSCWAVLRKAPPLPILPADVHGKEILALALLYAGDAEVGQQAVAPIRMLGTPIADVVGVQPFTAFQAAFDPLLAPGARNYWKSHDFSELDDAALELILEYAGRLPTPHCEIFVAHLGGAISRIASDVTAYPHRDAQFVLNVHTRWEDPNQDDECITWARKFFEATAPHATGGVYVNFLSRDEGERVEAAYGANYDRLVQVKTQYDPQNLFRLNQNIEPRI